GVPPVDARVLHHVLGNLERMICPRCGIINPDDTERCKRCQGSLARPPARRQETPARAVTDTTRPAPAEAVNQDAAEQGRQTEQPGHEEQPDPAQQAGPEPAPQPARQEPPGPAYPAPQEWQAPDWPAPPAGPSRRIP